MKRRLALSFWLSLLIVCGWALILSGFVLAQTQETQPVQPSTDKPENSLTEPTLPAPGLLKDESPVIPGASPAPGDLGPEYVIGPEDVLNIDVFNMPELTKSVRVSNDGTISLALLGRVEAAGFTPTQLRQKLESEWGETYLENPQVTVFVQEYRAQPVSVIGAVEHPGVYYLTGPRNLIQMLSMAGGLAKTGSPAGPTIMLTRKGGFDNFEPAEGIRQVAPDKLEINTKRLLFSRDEALNIPVRRFDTISVTKAEIIYVLGEVEKAGGFVLADRENITVMQALALAQGVRGTAAKKHATIVRTSQDGTRREIPIDVGRILKGQTPDPVLTANDIVYVPPSGSKIAAKRALDSTIGTVSGILIYRR